jgi:hypothetical protein
MLAISVSADSSAAPDVVLAAACDFSERRALIWRNCKQKYLKVHESGPAFAEVTEGVWVPGIGVAWERSRYDWSKPGVVSQSVIESNVLMPGSTWTLTAQAREGGGSDVTMTFNRIFAPGRRGRVGSFVNHLGGKRGWTAYLRKTLKQIESGI